VLRKEFVQSVEQIRRIFPDALCDASITVALTVDESVIISVQFLNLADDFTCLYPHAHLLYFFVNVVEQHPNKSEQVAGGGPNPLVLGELCHEFTGDVSVVVLVRLLVHDLDILLMQDTIFVC
jgi:hypothetical protein